MLVTSILSFPTMFAKAYFSCSLNSGLFGNWFELPYEIMLQYMIQWHKSYFSRICQCNISVIVYLFLNIFILHRLRNKFLQLILISLDSASWELHQYLRRMCGPMKNPEVETRSRDSNSGPQDCKADALPHDHGHHGHSIYSYQENSTKMSPNLWEKSTALAYHLRVYQHLNYHRFWYVHDPQRPV